MPLGQGGEEGDMLLLPSLFGTTANADGRERHFAHWLPEQLCPVPEGEGGKSGLLALLPWPSSSLGVAKHPSAAAPTSSLPTATALPKGQDC